MNPFTPKYTPISLAPPTPDALALDETLRAYIREAIPLETDKELEKRRTVLSNLVTIFKEWVKYVALHEANLSEDVADEVGGVILTSGSYKLGIHEPGADIDTVCVAPIYCSRQHFFGSLKERLLQHPQITNLIGIESARVPILTFDFENINIDLSLAILPQNSVQSINLLDDRLLQGVDEATATSLNGPRVTNMIEKIVMESAGTESQREERYHMFLEVLRCVRKWAKARGIYGNKFAYLGGVNFNILVAMVFQLYPTATVAMLLVNFFKVYSHWKWGNVESPIQLNEIVEMKDIGLKVWKPELSMGDLMPIITPAYPAMNSSYNVNHYTLQVMQTELTRGYEICKEIVANRGVGWEKLFESTDFFVKYSKYLTCDILSSKDDEETRAWIGYAQSRMRRFPECIGKLPLSIVHFHPKPLLTALQPSGSRLTFFTGFEVDTSRVKEDTVNMDRGVQDFYDASRPLENMPDSCDFLVELKTFKTLPKEVFHDLGGKAQAKVIHRQLLAAKHKKPSTETTAQQQEQQQQEGEEEAPEEKEMELVHQAETKTTEEGGAVESKDTEEQAIVEAKPKKRRRSDKSELAKAMEKPPMAPRTLPRLFPDEIIYEYKAHHMLANSKAVDRQPKKRIRSVTFEFLS